MILPAVTLLGRDVAVAAVAVLGVVPTPNLRTDAWLAALAMATDSNMVTFDHGFRGYASLQLTLLQA